MVEPTNIPLRLRVVADSLLAMHGRAQRSGGSVHLADFYGTALELEHICNEIDTMIRPREYDDVPVKELALEPIMSPASTEPENAEHIDAAV